MLPIIHYLCTSAYELSNLSRSSKVKKKTILQQKNKIFGLILASKVPLDAIKTFLLKQTAATAIIFRPWGKGVPGIMLKNMQIKQHHTSRALLGLLLPELVRDSEAGTQTPYNEKRSKGIIFPSFTRQGWRHSWWHHRPSHGQELQAVSCVSQEYRGGSTGAFLQAGGDQSLPGLLLFLSR